MMELIEIPQHIVDAVDKRMAEEAGMTLEEWKAELERHEREDWCRCEGAQPTEFWRDGECHLSHKHCYTCVTCGLLVQIG